MAEARPRARRRPAAAPLRKVQVERSERMRRRILDAAFEVLRERGCAGFTTAEVARHAGVSRGAQVHHFPSKNELVTAAMEHVFGISLADGMAMAEAARRSGRPLETLVHDAQAFYFSDHFYVGLDMLLAGAKDPALAQAGVRVVRNYRQPVERAWLEVMRGLGLPPDLCEDLLLLTVSLVRGFGIRHLWSPEPERVTRLLAMWQQMLAAYVRERQPDSADREAQAS